VQTQAPRVAFLTLEHRGDYVIDDALAIDELTRRGWRVDEVPWRRAGVDWRAWDAVVIRTTWDYQRDLAAFLATLDAIDAAGVPLANATPLVRWNARKTYLRDLAARGVPTVPTRWGSGLTGEEVRGLCGALGADECVVKPVVGANAEDTFRVARDEPTERASAVASRFEGRAWMAQPFVRSVLDEGERSVFYFGGAYSHAVVKVPKAGDFRVQEEHGGTIERLEPDGALRAASDRVMAALGEAPLQARVDLVRLDDGAFALMELEVIEPSLYFRTHPDAASHFADALSRWLPRASALRR
jgi:glutathione synthase/RimK-type ligase-like ATP-grasp enzyme